MRSVLRIRGQMKKRKRGSYLINLYSCVISPPAALKSALAVSTTLWAVSGGKLTMIDLAKTPEMTARPARMVETARILVDGKW